MVAIYPFIRPTRALPAFGKVGSIRGSGHPCATAARLARMAGQAVLLGLIYLASSAMVELLRIPVPSNLLALLLLLVLLATGLLRVGHVEELTTFLLRHVTFFFVPFTVGLMAQGPLLASSGVALFVSLIMATGVGMAIAGLAAQATIRWTGASYADGR